MKKTARLLKLLVPAMAATSLALMAIAHLSRRNASLELRDSLNDHDVMLSAGHAGLGQGSERCLYCHISHADKARDPQWLSQTADPRQFERDAAQAGGVQSGLCMSCHDGTVASPLKAHAASSANGRQPYQAIDLNAAHPIGVDYRAAWRKDPNAFIDPAQNDRIVLEDGNVGCLSCHATHDAKGAETGHLRPDVCTDCHRR